LDSGPNPGNEQERREALQDVLGVLMAYYAAQRAQVRRTGAAAHVLEALRVAETPLLRAWNDVFAGAATAATIERSLEEFAPLARRVLEGHAP